MRLNRHGASSGGVGADKVLVYVLARLGLESLCRRLDGRKHGLGHEVVVGLYLLAGALPVKDLHAELLASHFRFLGLVAGLVFLTCGVGGVCSIRRSTSASLGAGASFFGFSSLMVSAHG